jgi:hypothetical protein
MISANQPSREICDATRTGARLGTNTMPRENILLDFSNSETYECGAMLLAVLAYPSDSAGAKRREHVNSSRELAA